MHAPLAKFSMMRRLMSSAAWWLNSSAIDLDFQNGRAHDGIPLDPLLASTVLLLHGDGVDASTNISDSTGRHFVVNNGAEIDTAQSKFGGSSNLFVVGSVDFLNLDGSSDFAFGTGDFTIDFWVRAASIPTFMFLFSTVASGDSGNTYVDLYINPGAGFVFRRGAFDSSQITGTTVVVINTWYHVALTRASGSTRLFVNGVQEGSTFTDSTNYINSANRPVICASGYAQNSSLDGWIDELRVLKGAAAWTTTFTPPTMPYNIGVGPYDLLSCSRASIGYAQTVVGTLTQFAANQLRITDLGLLVEDARTNLALRSQEFDNSSWTTAAVTTTVTANAAVAPDGTTTADKLEATGSDSFVRQQVVGRATSTVHTYSVYLKADTPTTLNIYELDGTTSAVCNVTTTWQRFTLTWTSPGSGSFVDIQVGGGSSFTTGEIVYAWGAQVEAGAFASSYIPTTSGSATRAADVVTCIGNLSTDLLGSIGTALADVKLVGVPNTASNQDLIGGNSSNDIFYIQQNIANQIGINFGSGALATLGNSLLLTDGVKVGASWNSNAGASLVGGGGTVSSAAYNSGLSAVVRLGSGTFSPSFGYFRRLTAWTERLADASLQALTSPTGPSPTDYAVDLNFQTGVYTVNARPQFYLSCSRASIGYAQTVAGTLVQFPVNQLRITDKGLLVEDARTNLALQSADFSTTWSANAVTVTTNQTAAPDGTVTMDKFVDAATTDQHSIVQSGVVFSTGTTITLSVYVKDIDRRYVYLMSAGNVFAGSIFAFFDLQNGTVGDSGVQTAGTGAALISATIEALGSSIYRISITGTLNSSENVAYFVIALSDRSTNTGSFVGQSPSYLGSGKSIYAWGAQFEAGAFASSYIPTTTGSQARAADDIHLETSAKLIAAGAIASAVMNVGFLKDTTGTSYYLKWVANDRRASSSDSTHIIVVGDTAGTFNQPVLPSGSIYTTDLKWGWAWDASAYSSVLNGGTVLPTSGVVGTTGGTAYFGCGDTSDSTVNNYIRRFTLWLTRLADATLQGFTAP